MTLIRRTFGTAAATAGLVAVLLGIGWRLKAVGRGEQGAWSRHGALAPSGVVFSSDVAVPVVGARVVRDTFVVHASVSGQARAARTATLFAEVAGTVVGVPVREGERVGAGAVLARIDPARYALAVRRAEADIVRAQARFVELTLFDPQIRDTERRAEREAMVRVQSGLVEAEIAREQARLDLERATLRAPFGGRVANLAIVAGQRVTLGDSICAVVDLSEVRVEVRALEGEVVELRVGRRARVKFSALPERVFFGRVGTINPVVDPRTRTARVTVHLANPDGRIRPGMYAQARIPVRLYPDRVMVPREAILERDRRPLVFIFEPDSTGADVGLAKWTYVATGLENEEYVEVVPSEAGSVLEPGQVVLVEGHSTLTHDSRTRLVKP